MSFQVSKMPYTRNQIILILPESKSTTYGQ